MNIDWSKLKTAEQLFNEEQEFKAKEIRIQRNELLAETDYSVLPDNSSKDTSEMRAYRQALRDITSQDTFPNSVVWPTKPA
jgi:hypothetical protein